MASRITRCTAAAAVSSIFAERPISLGRRGRVIAIPMASRAWAVGADAGSGAGSCRTSNASQCGASPPSVPPDIMNALASETASRGRPVAPITALFSARVAKPRVKSLTQPLPSVLPSMATMRAGSLMPVSKAARRSGTSSGVAADRRWAVTPTLQSRAPWLQGGWATSAGSRRSGRRLYCGSASKPLWSAWPGRRTAGFQPCLPAP